MAKQPDYKVAALDKRIANKAGHNPNIGGAWGNPDGSITVKLYPFVVLPGGPDTHIVLFPNDRTASAQPGGAAPPDKDELPF